MPFGATFVCEWKLSRFPVLIIVRIPVSRPNRRSGIVSEYSLMPLGSIPEDFVLRIDLPSSCISAFRDLSWSMRLSSVSLPSSNGFLEPLVLNKLLSRFEVCREKGLELAKVYFLGVPDVFLSWKRLEKRRISGPSAIREEQMRPEDDSASPHAAIATRSQERSSVNLAKKTMRHMDTMHVLLFVRRYAMKETKAEEYAQETQPENSKNRPLPALIQIQPPHDGNRKKENDKIGDDVSDRVHPPDDVAV